MTEHVEVAVIGAGPAGLAAADVLGEAGCRTALLDEQPGPGGQIYRGIAAVDDARKRLLGDDYAAGARLLSALDHGTVEHLAGATVWQVTPDRRLSFSIDGKARSLNADQLLIATGAIERPMPFPGWTLPGVMTVGAGQILLKTSGLLPPSPCILAGSGPLLYLLATQYLAAGMKIDAIVETTPKGNFRKALKHATGALISNRYLRKGLAMLNRLRQAGIPHYRQARELVAEGKSEIEALTFIAGGERRTLPCRSLLLHVGVTPNVQISRSLHFDHEWDPLQSCWRPRIDPLGGTSLPGIRIAGDGAGIAGAEAAIHGGRLAAFAILAELGKLTPDQHDAIANRDLLSYRRHARARPFLDALYAPSPEFLDPSDDAVICRCEEVTAGQIRSFVDLGCKGPNQAKAFGRSGMGPCQGRYCGLTVSSVIAAKRGAEMADVGYYRIRPPLKPITLGELATMAIDDDGYEQPEL
ncbi:MAG: FAD-dependent oxidoreductase [Geminicoccaceae bacterium]